MRSSAAPIAPSPPDQQENESDGFIQIPPFDRADRGPHITVLRHTVSADALLSAEEVVRLLGGRSSVTRRWLREVPALWHPNGRLIYRWGDVLDRLREKAKEVA